MSDDFGDSDDDSFGDDGAFEQATHYATWNAAMVDLRLGFMRVAICEELAIEPGELDMTGEDIDEDVDITTIGTLSLAVKVRECTAAEGALLEGLYCIAVQVGADVEGADADGWRDYDPGSEKEMPAGMMRADSAGGAEGSAGVDTSGPAWRACWWGDFIDDGGTEINYDTTHERGPPYEVLPNERAVLRRMVLLMRKVALEIGEFGGSIAPDLCVALLREYAWDPTLVAERYFDAEVQAFVHERFGTPIDIDAAALEAEAGEEWEACPTCMTTDEGTFMHLGIPTGGSVCSSAICVECWRDSLTGWITTGGAGVLNHTCPLAANVIPDSVWQRFLSPTDWARFVSRAADEYVASNRRTLRCIANPKGGCSCIIESSLVIRMARTNDYVPCRCTCGAAFCLSCAVLANDPDPARKCAALGELKHNCGDHRPATCAMAAKWLSESTGIGGDDALSDAWLTANTKHCPRCNALIAKEAGCYEMACSECNTKFCYECGQTGEEWKRTHYSIPNPSKVRGEMIFKMFLYIFVYFSFLPTN